MEAFVDEQTFRILSVCAKGDGNTWENDAFGYGGDGDKASKHSVWASAQELDQLVLIGQKSYLAKMIGSSASSLIGTSVIRRLVDRGTLSRRQTRFFEKCVFRSKTTKENECFDLVETKERRIHKNDGSISKISILDRCDNVGVSQ